jgi:hypothetical protein
MEHFLVLNNEIDMWFNGQALAYKEDEKPISLDEIPKLEVECPVCFGGEELLVLSCMHVVCFSCFGSLAQKTCPMCRTEIDEKKIRKF